MMKSLHASVTLAALLVLFCYADSQSQVAPGTTATLVVGSDGRVTLQVEMRFPNRLADSLRGLYALVLPIQLSANRRFIAPADVAISELRRGKGYTMLVLSAPRKLGVAHLEIIDGLNTLETADGRGKLEFDLSFAFLSQLEREQLASPVFITPERFRVILPRRYDYADIGLSASFGRTSQPDVFDLKRPALVSVGTEPAWISFPNPSQGALDRAKLLFAILLGCLALPFQIQPLRDRKLRSLLVIFSLALAVLVVTGYYWFVLSKRWDFMSYTAAAIPSALYTLGASIYLAIATRLQAGITGQVQISGAPAKVVLVCVSGEKVDGSGGIEWKTLADTASLDANGRYQFFVWLKKNYKRYKVIATRNENVIESDTFPLRSHRNHEVPVLNLQP